MTTKTCLEAMNMTPLCTLCRRLYQQPVVNSGEYLSAHHPPIRGYGKRMNREEGCTRTSTVEVPMSVLC